jgi:outer membrane lipoprotein-sorting protein
MSNNLRHKALIRQKHELGRIILAALVMCLFLTASDGWAEPLTAKDVLDKVDDLYRSDSSRGEMTMAITTAHWKRSLTMEFWTKGKEQSLIRILAPKKEEGTATLRSGNEIWNYLPKVKRVIKLPSSMMSASWMGSHFSNDDLVKESRFVDDYEFEISFQGLREGKEVVEITCTPKPQAPVVWGRVVVTVDRENLLPMVTRYYDEELQLARSMAFCDRKILGGRMLPASLTVVPADKPDEKTEVTYDRITFDLRLSDDVFSLRNLQR